MNHIDEQDNLDEFLVKSGDYLMNRAAQYREQPVVAITERRHASPRLRRFIVGSIAAAVLCTTALAGSFIGSSTSGKVDVANAAWTAKPAVISESVRKDFAISCNSIVAEFWRSGTSQQLNETQMPDSLKEPTLVDFRGTTKLGVYFGGDLILVCLLFEGRGVMVQRIDGFGGPSKDGLSGSLNAITLEVDGKSVGLIFGDLPANAKSITSVRLKQSGQEGDFEASMVEQVGRYVAWSPVAGEVSLTFVGASSEVIGSLGPKAFLPPCLGSCFGAPTTIPG